MRIIHVITKSNWGGAQKHVHDISLSLHEKHDVTVLTGGNGPLVEKLQNAGVNVITIPHLERDVSIVKELFVVIFLIKQYRKIQPHIIHLHSSKIGILGSLAARIALFKKRKKIIFTAHGWVFNETHRPIFIQRILKVLSYITVFLTHTTITLSKKEHDQMALFGVRSKLSIIPLGLTSPQLYSQLAAREILIQKQPALKKYIDDGWIMTIAELHSNKNIESAIEAMVSVPKVPYIVIGEGEERDHLESLIKKHDLGDRVFLVGHVDEASRLLSAGDMFILPSRKEGLPYTLLEAGFANLPIIATRVGGIPELITDGTNGFLFTPDDSDNLSHIISEILSHKEQSRHIGQKMKMHVMEHYSYDVMLKKIIGMYTL